MVSIPSSGIFSFLLWRILIWRRFFRRRRVSIPSSGIFSFPLVERCVGRKLLVQILFQSRPAGFFPPLRRDIVKFQEALGITFQSRPAGFFHFHSRRHRHRRRGGRVFQSRPAGFFHFYRNILPSIPQLASFYPPPLASVKPKTAFSPQVAPWRRRLWALKPPSPSPAPLDLCHISLSMFRAQPIISPTCGGKRQSMAMQIQTASTPLLRRQPPTPGAKGRSRPRRPALQFYPRRPRRESRSAPHRPFWAAQCAE